MIPSEMELASRYKVSQGTVRKAIDELAGENTVARRGAKPFVTTHHEDGVKFRFLRLVPDEGEPHYGASHVLECKRLRAPAEIARLLDIRTGDSVVQIRRVLFFSGEATVLDEIWLLGTNFKGLTAEKLTEWKGPMYALFEAEFGTRMIRASERFVRCRPIRPPPRCSRCPRARRCCRWSGSRSPMGIGLSKSGAVCMSRRATIIRTI